MRTPNTKCLLCGKLLYRRPYELAKFRYAACMKCRSDAQKVVGITEKQHAGLRLGRPKGTNHRAGYHHRIESRQKASASHKLWCAVNADKVASRSAKIRGPLHFLWKGGITKLNKSIRQMTENRRWMDAVKERDGRCIRCGGTERLESHHLVELAALIDQLEIKTRDDARKHAAILFDVSNGVTLCEICHYSEHGRVHREDIRI